MTKHKNVNAARMRIRIASAATFVLLLLLCGVYVGVAAKSGGNLVGFISSVQGKATLKRGGFKEAKLDGMNALRAGDIVRVSAKSTVVVNLCGLSQRVKMPGAAVFTVAKNGLQITKGKPGAKTTFDKTMCSTLMASAAKYDHATYVKSTSSDAAGAMSVLGLISSRSSGSGGGAMKDMMRAEERERDSARKSNDNAEKSSEGANKSAARGLGNAQVADNNSYEAMGGIGESESADTAGGSGVVLKEDRIAKPNPVYITEPRPEKNVFSYPFIAWDPIAFAKTYNITFTDAVNVKIFYATTEQPYTEYPINAPPLLPGGWYLCEITATDENGQVVSEDMFGLSVRGEKDQASFRNEEKSLLDVAKKGSGPDAWVLLGRFYESYGLLLAASGAYEKALALDPKDTALQSHQTELGKKLYVPPK
jgi:hypothetical protein